MATAYKNNNFISAASFAQRLLELDETRSDAELKKKTLNVLQKSEKQARNEYSIDYDEKNPFVLDCGNLKPLYRGTNYINCPYCGSAYTQDALNKVCNTCGISLIGVETIGLVTSTGSTRR